MKHCTRCFRLRDLTEYGQNGPYLRSHCKACEVVRVRQYYNQEKRKEYNRQYRASNMEHIRQIKQKYESRKRAEDIQYGIRTALRRRVGEAVKRGSRAGSAVRDLGCSISAFKLYIENQFESDMSWHNYGQWHLDHIVPLSHFDLTNRQQFLEACNWLNYQPLWAIENLLKSDSGLRETEALKRSVNEA